MTIKAIGWNIAPSINGTIRFGTKEEKENLFQAMLENCTETLPYKKRGSTEEEQQPMAEAMARISANVKGRQDRARDKSVKELDEQVIEKGLQNENILMVNATDTLDKSLTGLVAMQLAQKYKRPTLILHEGEIINDDETTEKTYHGSGRNFNNSPVDDFKGLLDSLSLFNYVEGHPNAYGFEVSRDKLIEVKNKTDILLQDIEFSNSYRVDFIIPSNKLSNKTIKPIVEFAGLWGKGLDEPLLAIEEIIVDSKDIQLIGKNLNTIKFVHGGIEYVKFYTNTDVHAEMTQHETVRIDVVGRCSVNEWAGKKTYQIIIEDFTCEKSAEFLF